jgi:hypothetical protein
MVENNKGYRAGWDYLRPAWWLARAFVLLLFWRFITQWDRNPWGPEEHVILFTLAVGSVVLGMRGRDRGLAKPSRIGLGVLNALAVGALLSGPLVFGLFFARVEEPQMMAQTGVSDGLSAISNIQPYPRMASR